MHPISFKFVAKNMAILLAIVAAVFLAKDLAAHAVFLTVASAAFLFGAIKVARHVVNLNSKHQHLGLLVSIGVQLLTLVFAALFLSGTFAWIPFLLLEIIGFMYFAFRK